jgi:hypothetical protein
VHSADAIAWHMSVQDEQPSTFDNHPPQHLSAPTVAHAARCTAAPLDQNRVALALWRSCLQLLLRCKLVWREHAARATQVDALCAAYAYVGRLAAALRAWQATQQAAGTVHTAQRQQQRL